MNPEHEDNAFFNSGIELCRAVKWSTLAVLAPTLDFDIEGSSKISVLVEIFRPGDDAHV